IPETHDLLLARARALHPEEAIPDDAPSRFKKDGTDAPAPAATPASAPAAPAAVQPAPVRAAAPTAARGKVGKATAPPPPAPPKTFARELPGDLDQIVTTLGAARRRPGSRLALLPLALLAAGQGFLGALPAATKRRLEEAVGDRRFFNAQLATAGNVFLNLVLYPVGCMALAVAAGRASLFSSDVQGWIVLGVVLAFAEAAWRLRESVFRGASIADTPLRGAVYGPLLLPLAALVLALVGRRGASSGVSFDGFH